MGVNQNNLNKMCYSAEQGSLGDKVASLTALANSLKTSVNLLVALTNDCKAGVNGLGGNITIADVAAVTTSSVAALD